MISVIIPCFNMQDYLADAIDSALDQTVPCEIIVVDDGSTDHSLEIAKGYKKKIKVIHQKNKGLSTARNVGIKKATGEYILPLDADDILLETAIEKIELAIKQSGADVVAPSFKTFGLYHQTVILNQIPTLQDFVSANRLGYFSAIRKTVLEEVGGYNPNMKWGYEDYELWINIFKRGKKLCMLSEPLVLYRTKENSMLTESKKHHEELMAQIRANHPELWPASA